MEIEQEFNNMDMNESDKNFEEYEQASESEKGFKLFGLYDVSEVKVNDPGMKKYINLEPKLVVKSYGRIREKFSKGRINIIEFLR